MATRLKEINEWITRINIANERWKINAHTIFNLRKQIAEWNDITGKKAQVTSVEIESYPKIVTDVKKLYWNYQKTIKKQNLLIRKLEERKEKVRREALEDLIYKKLSKMDPESPIVVIQGTVKTKGLILHLMPDGCSDNCVTEGEKFYSMNITVMTDKDMEKILDVWKPDCVYDILW